MRQRASDPVLDHTAHREHRRSALAVLPEQTRSSDGAAKTGKIRPAVQINIRLGLLVRTRKEGVAPLPVHVVGHPSHDVGSTQRTPVQDQLPFSRGTARNQVDHPAECG